MTMEEILNTMGEWTPTEMREFWGKLRNRGSQHPLTAAFETIEAESRADGYDDGYRDGYDFGKRER